MASILFWHSFLLVGQDLSKLRDEREKHIKDIALSEELLSKTSEDRANSEERLKLVNNKIRGRQQVINGMNKELNLLKRQIALNQEEVEVLEREINRLKEEYARMIYKTYLNYKSYHRAQYILAATDFNQAFKRIKYMQQYSRYRKEQSDRIMKKAEELNNKKGQLEKDKTENDRLILENQREIIKMNNEKGLQEKYRRTLQQRERQLRNDIEEKRRVNRRLEEEIANILAAATGEEVGSTGMPMTPEMKIISNEFNNSLGRLPWPVARGIITTGYGRQRHQALSSVTIDNKGVDITTEGGAPVLAVFNGKVKRVFTMQGANTIVLVQHGDYFTVYKGLVDVNVKEGERVTLRQELGKAHKELKAGNSEVHFELWKGTENLNPEVWLAK